MEKEKALKKVNKIRWEYKVVRLTKSFIEEQLDDLKDELIVLHLKYGEILEKLNSDIDRLFEMLNLVR